MQTLGSIPSPPFFQDKVLSPLSLTPTPPVSDGSTPLERPANSDFAETPEPDPITPTIPSLQEVPEKFIDTFLAPHVVISNPVRLDVVSPTGWTNSWTLSPEFVKGLLSIPWPNEKRFSWFKDLYPSDFDPASPQEGRSVFRRRFFTRPTISNPPYDPQRDTPSGNVFTLVHHVTHLVQCARNGLVEHIIVLPLRQRTSWYRWLERQPDVALIHVQGRCYFLRGPSEQTVGPAPFDTLLVLVGTDNSRTTATYSTGRFTFCARWLRSVKWIYSKWSPQVFQYASHPTFSTWDDFYVQALALTEERLQRTPVCPFQAVAKLLVDLPLVAPPGGRSAFQTLQEHTSPHVSLTPKMFSPSQAESYRATHDQRFRNRTIVPCVHCHRSDHFSNECWRMSSKKSVPIVSDRLRTLVKSLYRTKFISRWSLPTRDSSETLGSFLIHKVFPAYLTRGRWVWNKIHPPGAPDLTGMFDGQFSQIQQRAFMWLVIDAPKHVVAQILTGFAPRWIDAELPERIFVSSKNPFTKQARTDVQTRDADHEKSGRITRIPRELTHSYVWSTAARFPIYQLQDDLSQKLRIIYNARIFNFRLPERKFTLPTVRVLTNELVGWFISIDLSKAYFQVPLEWNSRKFFGAKFADTSQELFLFNSWPFGVSSAPSLCQFLVLLVVQWIRRVTGWLILVYLDDFLLRIATEDDVEASELALRVEFVRAVFESLGLIINAKSCLVPAKELKWLGWYLNSEFHRAFGSKSKLFKFKTLALKLANQNQATIHDLQSIKGLFAFFATKNNRFLARPIDFTLTAAFKNFGLVNPSKDDFARYAKYSVSLPTHTQTLFRVWGQEILSSLSLTSMSLTPVQQVVVVCDAAEHSGGFYTLYPTTVSPVLLRHDQNFINKELEQLSTCELTTMTLPHFAQMRTIGSARSQPASFTRECVTLLQAVLSTLPKVGTVPTLVSVLTDNQGLAKCFSSIKPRTPALFHAIAKFRSALPSNVKVQVEWHPRDTPLAQLADHLSKVGHMRLTSKGRSFIKSHIPFVPPILINSQRLLLTSRYWIRQFHNSPQTFLVHPYTLSSEINSLFQLMQEFHVQGVVVSPYVPDSFHNHIVTKVSSRSPFFSFDFHVTECFLYVVRLWYRTIDAADSME